MVISDLVFSYPKEDKINANWDKWQNRVDTVKGDLVKLFVEHFEASDRRNKEEEAKDALLGL